MWLALCLLGCVLVTGCRDNEHETTATRFEIDKAYERGPLTVHVRLEKAEITLAETVTLELEAATTAEYEVKFPSVNEILQNFGIVDWDHPENHLDDAGRIVHTYSYRLEPFISGQYSIPAFTFQFYDVNDPNNIHELPTEPLDIKVTTLLDPQRDELVIEDIEDVVTPPKPRSYAWVWLLGVLVPAVAVGAFLMLRKKKVAALVRIFKPAHEIAYARLRVLVAEKLIETNRIKEFYERISGILRYYIEDRFDLRAPERTTEEFLFELRNSNALPQPWKESLQEFLTHCDLVKFARHDPTPEQIQRTFDLVKQFIEQTKSDDRKIDVTDRVGSIPSEQSEETA